ncbi:MAG TPA: L,D-transpeptidase family protein [Conexibacter sp.]|jgi:hypothetical protein
MHRRVALPAFAAAVALVAAPAAAVAEEAPADPSVAQAAATPSAGADPQATTTPSNPTDPGAGSGTGTGTGNGAPSGDPGSSRDDGTSRVNARAPITRPQVRRVAGRVGISFASGVNRVNGTALALPGRDVKITGRVVPFVAGEKVAVRIWNGSRLAKTVTVRPKPTKTKQTATFTATFTPGRSGAVKVFAVHTPSPQQSGFQSKGATLAVVNPMASPGDSGPFVSLLQQKLAALGYAVPQSGSYDLGTQLAVEAYRKVLGVSRLQTLDPTVVSRLLSGVGTFHVRFPQHGRHVEANLGQQVLALIDNGRVQRIYTTSSGKPSTPTVLGNFRFYWKDWGTNSEGMVDSNYFIRGYAIHGYASVPTYAASHGCLRVPVSDAAAIFDWVHVGDQIDVYY